MVDVQDCSERMRMTPGHLRKLIKAGLFIEPVRNARRKLTFSRIDFEEYMRLGGVAGAEDRLAHRKKKSLKGSQHGGNTATDA